MCCFSGSVQVVSGTSIFARAIDSVRQALIYEMSLAAAGELAMVLPIPVPVASLEDAVRFVSLKRYPDIFRDMKRAFPEEQLGFQPMPRFAPQAKSASLVVHDVGDFEASFVPRAVDFDRLDKRFRLPSPVLAALSGYADWGFAVFKLKASSSKKRFHPMAFVFPRRDPSRLFFPTVHVHDGKVHETAHFDHALYMQGARTPAGWEASAQAASSVVDDARTEGLVEPMSVLLRRTVVGEAPNRDIVVELR